MLFCKLNKKKSTHNGMCFVLIALGILPWPLFCNGATKAFLDARTILDGWEANYGSIQTMKIRISERAVEVTIPDANGLVRNQFVERIQDGKLYYCRYSKAENGLADKNTVIQRSFDGNVTKGYMPMEKAGRISPGLTGDILDRMNHLEIYMMISRLQSKTYKEEFPEGISMFSILFRSGIKDGRIQVHPELETVANESCHIVEIPRGRETDRIWIAHDKGMLPMKREVIRDGKVIRKFEVLKVSKTGTDTPGLWYPSQAYREIMGSQGGTIKYEFRADEFVPYLSVPLSTFNVDFPIGTRITDEVAGITYVKGGSERSQLPKSVVESPPVYPEPDPNITELPEESKLSEVTDTISNEFNDQNAVQHEGDARQDLEEGRKPRQYIVAYSLLGITVLMLLSMLLLHRYGILQKGGKMADGS